MKVKKTLVILLTAMLMIHFNGCGMQEPLSESEGKEEENIIIETDNSDTEDVQKEAGEEIREEDRQTAEPQATVHISNPSWDYYIAEETESQASPLKLVQTMEEPNNIIDTEEWFERNQLSAPMENDESYIYDIVGADYLEGYLLKVYERDTGELIADMDFSDYRYADDFVEQEREFVQQRIRCVKIRDQIMYVSIGHNTYASSSPHNAYIAAIDLSDMSVIWKTEPLVSNANNFEIIDDVIVCAYGFTNEEDYLNQLDIRTGIVIDRIPLKTKADYIIRKDNTLYVRTYNTDYTFDIPTE